jgi:hypothetical protein
LLLILVALLFLLLLLLMLASAFLLLTTLGLRTLITLLGHVGSPDAAREMPRSEQSCAAQG